MVQWTEGERAGGNGLRLGNRDPYEPEQLTLADDAEALPWLEAEDDDEVSGGFDTRMILLTLLGLVGIAAIAFAAWYMLSKQDDPALIPDGSTIMAPDAPYKVRPENPGGAEVEGTGELSYIVGEGGSREGVIVEDAPAPSIDLEQSGATSEQTGVGVQVGAFSTRVDAQNGWVQLRARYEVLQGLSHRIVEGSADSGTIYRLQAITAGDDAADAVCRAIRDAGGDCQVKS